LAAKKLTQRLDALRNDLLGAQQALTASPHRGIALVLTGVPAAGRSEVAHALLKWLDPKRISTHAATPAEECDRRRPPLWRHWQELPAQGRLAIFFGGWYDEYVPMASEHGGKKALKHRARVVERIRRFETMLRADGMCLIKVHLAIDVRTQRKRLKKLRGDKTTRWRVSGQDLWLADHHARVARHFRQLQAATGTPVPWNVVDGRDDDRRLLSVGTLLLQAYIEAATPPAAVVKPSESAQGSAAKAATATARGAHTRSTAAAGKRSEAQAAMPSLDEAVYEREKEKWQGRLALLTRKKKFAGRAVVLAFEGMDAAGKGGAIQRLTQALDVRQYEVVPVSAPTQEEKLYPYLWRFWKHVPALGRFGIFDRSWYGRVLVERVRGFAAPADWRRAYEEINEFELELAESRALVMKFWLAVSPAEQLRRFEARDQDPLKRFKVDPEDWINRKYFQDYALAAREMLDRTHTRHAPWTVVDADDKYRARLAVLQGVCQGVEEALSS